MFEICSAELEGKEEYYSNTTKDMYFSPLCSYALEKVVSHTFEIWGNHLFNALLIMFMVIYAEDNEVSSSYGPSFFSKVGMVSCM